MCRVVLTLARSLKEEPHHQHLQHRHADHHADLDQAELEDPLLRAPDRAEVAILSCPEILLHAVHGAQLARDLEHEVLQLVVLFAGRAGLLRQERGRRAAGALDLDLEVDVLVREGGHGVGEAEGVGAHRLRGEDVVALPLFLAREDLSVVRVEDGVVDVEGAAGLDLVVG